MGIFHVYTAFFGVLTALWQRSIHLTFGFLICYLTAVAGASLKRWIGGAAPFTDVAPRDSHGPTSGHTWYG